MKKILFLVIIFLFSCKTEKKNIISKNQPEIIEELPVKVSKIFEKNDLEGHTFFKIDFNEQKDTILYKYCAADLRTYRIYKEKIFLNYGQEFYFMNIKGFSKENNSLKYRVKFIYYNEEDGKEEIFTFKSLDKKNKYWQINDEIYIDSLYLKDIPLVKEADPCPEDY